METNIEQNKIPELLETKKSYEDRINLLEKQLKEEISNHDKTKKELSIEKNKVQQLLKLMESE